MKTVVLLMIAPGTFMGFLHPITAGEGRLEFAPMKKAYRIGKPMRVKILNRSDREQEFVVGLQVGSPDGGYRDVLEDIALATNKSIGHGFAAPPHGSVAVSWVPQTKLSKYKIIKRSTYRLALYTKSALLGGGAVYASPSFRFVVAAPIRR